MTSRGGARTIGHAPCPAPSDHPSGRCGHHGGFALTGAPDGKHNAVVTDATRRTMSHAGNHYGMHLAHMVALMTIMTSRAARFLATHPFTDEIQTHHGDATTTTHKPAAAFIAYDKLARELRRWTILLERCYPDPGCSDPTRRAHELRQKNDTDSDPDSLFTVASAAPTHANLPKPDPADLDLDIDPYAPPTATTGRPLHHRDTEGHREGQGQGQERVNHEGHEEGHGRKGFGQDLQDLHDVELTLRRGAGRTGGVGTGPCARPAHTNEPVNHTETPPHVISSEREKSAPGLAQPGDGHVGAGCGDGTARGSCTLDNLGRRGIRGARGRCAPFKRVLSNLGHAFARRPLLVRCLLACSAAFT